MPHTAACSAAAASRSVRIRAWAVVAALLLAALTDTAPRPPGARAVSAEPSHQEGSPAVPALSPTPTDVTADPSPTTEADPTATSAPAPSATTEAPPPDLQATPSPTAEPSPTVEPTTPPIQPPTQTEIPDPTSPAETPELPGPPPSPTETLSPTPPLTPAATSTPYAGDPPLELALRASSSQVAPGGSLSYQLQLSSTSAAPHGVLVLTKLDPHLTAVGVSTSSGVCQLGPVVVCNAIVQRGQAVSMQIDLRVQAEVRPDQVLVSQASARDTAYNAASSEPVRVTIMAPQDLRPVAPAGPTAAARPTAPPSPTSAPQQPGGSPEEQPPGSGRITGTVIDLSSGAPAPGVRVRIGETTVSSDASGNYGLQGLAPGTYLVELSLGAGQGDPEQPPLLLALGPGEVLVQHLMFRSAARPAAPPAASPAADPDTPAPQPERTARPQSAVQAQTGAARLLPDTGSAPAMTAAALTLFCAALLLRSLRRLRSAAALLAEQMPGRAPSLAEVRQRLGSGGWQAPQSSLRLADRRV